MEEREGLGEEVVVWEGGGGRVCSLLATYSLRAQDSHILVHISQDPSLTFLPYTLTHSLTYTLTHSLTYSLTHSLTYSQLQKAF